MCGEPAAQGLGVLSWEKGGAEPWTTLRVKEESELPCFLLRALVFCLSSPKPASLTMTSWQSLLGFSDRGSS